MRTPRVTWSPELTVSVRALGLIFAVQDEEKKICKFERKSYKYKGLFQVYAYHGILQSRILLVTSV